LQSGEAAPAPTQRTGGHERPERQERGNYQDSRPRMRSDDRRAPRGESRERFERPQRFAERREERSPRVGAPSAAPARPSESEAPRRPEKHSAPPTQNMPSTGQISGEAPSAPRRSRGNETQTGKKPETPHVVSCKSATEKTFSDEEILASVKPEPRKPVESRPPGKSAPPWKRREHSEEKAVRPPKQ